MLLAIDTTTKHLDTRQSTMQQSLLTLSGSVQSVTRNKCFGEDDEAYKYALEKYINQYPVQEAVFLQYSCQKSASLLSTLVLNKK